MTSMFNYTYLVFLAFLGEKNVGVLTFFYLKGGVLVFVCFSLWSKGLHFLFFNYDPIKSW